MNEWFESVAEVRRLAEKRLPRSVYSALWAGSEHGVTLKDNVAAFDELGFAPHVAGHAAERDLTTTVMGQTLALPVLLSPTGAQAVHPEGEVAVARAGAARGTALGLSSFATKPVEDVVAANPQTFLQVYWSGNREQIAARLERGRRAGVTGVILTLDWSFSHSRDWGSPHIPEKLGQGARSHGRPRARRLLRCLGATSPTVMGTAPMDNHELQWGVDAP